MCSSEQTPMFSPHPASVTPSGTQPRPFSLFLPALGSPVGSETPQHRGRPGWSGRTYPGPQTEGSTQGAPGTQACLASCLHNVPPGLQEFPRLTVYVGQRDCGPGCPVHWQEPSAPVFSAWRSVMSRWQLEISRNGVFTPQKSQCHPPVGIVFFFWSAC